MRAIPALLLPLAACAPADVHIGSKSFTESVVLGEIAAGLAASEGVTAEHRSELGGTQIVWKALLAGEIDAYAEYTGTLTHEVFAGRGIEDDEGLERALAEEGVVSGGSLGFVNNYAIGMREADAERLGIRRISDLAGHPDLAFGFSSEFVDREDGWPGLRAAYGLPQQAVGLSHDLAYRGLESGTLDAIDLYTTDAEIEHYGLRALEDDRGYFPEYRAMFLWRADLEERAPGWTRALRGVAGRVDQETMIALNARAKLERVPEARVAADFLRDELGVEIEARVEGRGAQLLRTTLEHLALVAVSLGAAILLALPLGVLAARRARLGQLVLGCAGVLQTIPSLALFVFLIPLLGIGAPPAVAALFLYSLLPIVRNTHAGLTGISPALIESAEALGLSPRARLRRVELPLASPSILAGVQTSAVINVGTATLGALVGAGGYGQPILTGIRLDDTALILSGAVPAALLALAVQGLFELAGRRLVPLGLRIGSGT